MVTIGPISRFFELFRFIWRFGSGFFKSKWFFGREFGAPDNSLVASDPDCLNPTFHVILRVPGREKEDSRSRSPPKTNCSRYQDTNILHDRTPCTTFWAKWQVSLVETDRWKVMRPRTCFTNGHLQNESGSIWCKTVRF